MAIVLSQENQSDGASRQTETKQRIEEAKASLCNAEADHEGIRDEDVGELLEAISQHHRNMVPLDAWRDDWDDFGVRPPKRLMQPYRATLALIARLAPGIARRDLLVWRRAVCNANV